MFPYTPTVGIVVLTHNRVDCTSALLESLSEANCKTPAYVLIIDNQSSAAQFEELQLRFRSFQRKSAIPGELVRQRRNLGFAAGNNEGLRILSHRRELTHYCLLNSDVMVADGWLDKLVFAAGEKAFAGPVTNASGNEQCVPITYHIALQQTTPLDIGAVREFAATWATEREGRVVKTAMLAFHCILAAKRLFETVGDLDEGFGAGYFEDDDYCKRAEAEGFRLNIAWDCYVHHWGGASFSNERKSRRQSLFSRNQLRYEQKHGVNWSAEHKLQRYLQSLAHDIANSRSSKPYESNEARLCLFQEHLYRDLNYTPGKTLPRLLYERLCQRLRDLLNF